MDDLDLMLARLAAAPTPPALASVDAAVLARVTSYRRPHFSNAMLGGAAFLALVTGIAGGVWPIETNHASDTLAPLGGASPLAPSTLLASNQ